MILIEKGYIMTMTVKELIDVLHSFPSDAQVIIQKDGEGNDYSPLYCADGNAIYVPETTWSGIVHDTNWTAEDAGWEQSEWDNLLKQPRCVVLVPIN